MTPNVIPITPLYLRYRALRSADQAERLRYARDVLANPAWLAEEFVTTLAFERAWPEHRTILHGMPLMLPTILGGPVRQESDPWTERGGKDDTAFALLRLRT